MHPLLRTLAACSVLAVLLPTAAAAAPTITFVTPSTMPTQGGIPITITGTNFGVAPGSALFGSAAAEPMSWTDSRVIVAAPEGTPGQVTVLVIDDAGVQSNEYPVSYDGPVITSVLPPQSSRLGGTVITIVGENFGPKGAARSWVFGGVLAGELCWDGHDRVLLTSPPGTGGDMVPVSVLINGISSNSVLHEFLPPPLITGIEPVDASTSGGIPLTIRGNNFGDGARAFVGGHAAPVVSSSPDGTEIVCVLPPGFGQSSVLVAAGADLSEPFAFDYAPPVITEVDPPSASASGGVRLTIRGENFGPPSAKRVWLVGGQPAANEQWVSHTEVLVDAPPGAPGETVDVDVFFAPYGKLPNGFSYSGSLAVDGPAPAAFALRQNYPNPFAGRTEIAMEFAAATPFRLAIFDIQGRLVNELHDVAAAGARTVRWDGTDATGAAVGAGVYFYRLEAGDFVSVKRMIVSR